MVLIYAWVLLVTLWVSKGPMFAFTTVHALQSAFFGVLVCILAMFHGFSLPVVLMPFFIIEFFVFLFSKRGWFEGYERCMGYMFRSSIIPFVALISEIPLEQAAIPFVIAGMLEGLYVVFQKLVDSGKIKHKFHYNHKVGRFVGTLGNPNQASEFLLVTLIIAIWISLTWPVFFWSVPFILAGLVFTAGRATLVSLAVGSLSISIFYPLSLLVSIPVIALGAWFMRKRLKLDSARMLFWKVLFREKIKHPFRMEGMNVSIYADSLSDTELKKRMIIHPLDRSHNWFLDLFIEGGLLYVGAFIFAGVWGLIMLPPILKCALLILLTNEFFSFPFQPNYLLWAFLVAGGSTFAFPLWILAPFLAYGFYIGIRAYLAGNALVKKSDTFLDVYHNYRTALDWSSSVYLEASRFLGRNAMAFKQLLPAEAERFKKITSGPKFGEVCANLASVYFKAGDKKKMFEYVEKGLKASPGNIELRRLRGLTDKEAYIKELHEITRDFLNAQGKSKALETPYWIDLVLNTQNEQYLDEYRKRFDEDLKLPEVTHANQSKEAVRSPRMPERG